INQKVYGGWKSGITGIDLEFDKDNIRYIVTIKSGPNWGNSSQTGKMKSDFITAKRTLRTSNSGLIITPINGCCYGKDNRPDKGDYFKYCGQKFWTFISGEDTLFTDIIGPLGYKAREKNDVFMESYAQMINKFTKEFANDFCNNSGQIEWKKLVEFNSGEK
ncbi:MAG: cytosolic protein, partial [Bacteroidales bacterium]|nr:cytosolic protein [Bacteroidales bacterium]